MKLRSIVYDLDGTLIDSEALQEQKWGYALQKEFGREIDPKHLILQKGMPGLDAAKMMLGPNSSPEERKLLFSTAMEFVYARLDQVRVFDTAIETIKRLQEKGLEVAVCTSAPWRFVNGIHRAFPSLANLLTIAREDYTTGKPSAEPLQVTSQRLDLDPKEIIYVGDARSDYACATAAGVREFVYFCPGEDKQGIPPEVRRIRSHAQILEMIE